VSRTLGQRLTTTLAAHPEQRLTDQVLALFWTAWWSRPDGHCGAGPDARGRQAPARAAAGVDENAVLCTELPQDLLGRGLAIPSGCCA
jgi:hypothetical protein